MKKRYIPSILIVLCLLITACVGDAYAKYASEEKAENVFILSSDVQFKTYTYAVLDEATNALFIRSRQAMVGGEQLIEANSGSYNLTQVYRLPGAEFDESTPSGAQPWPANTNFSARNKITSVTVEDDIQLVSAYESTWFQRFTQCTKLDLAKLTLSAPTTFTSSYISNSTALTNVSLPKNVTAISADCFSGRTALVSVTLPDGVKSIGNGAFSSCTALTTVNLGTGLETVGNNAFSGCTALTEVKLGDAVKTIGYFAFRYCAALTKVGLEGNTKLTTIGQEAFQNCASLESIYLPDTITTMDKWCFNGCISLTEVHIPQNLKGFSEGLFSGCVNLTVDTDELIPASVTYVNGNAFTDCSKITATVTISSKVSVLGTKAFSGCSSITKVTLSNGLSNGAQNAFEGTGIKEIHIPGSFIKGNLTAEIFKDCKDLTKVTIENGVKSIGKGVFYGCTNLTTIKIPDSVTTIDDQAFGGRDEGSPCVIFYNGTAAGPANDNPETTDVEENWGNVIVVNSKNLGNVPPTCNNPGELNGDTSNMNITLPEGVNTDKLFFRIGQNTAEGFVSDSKKLVEKNADDTFDIPVAEVTQKLITLSVPKKEQYAVYSDTTKTLYFLNDILIEKGEDIPNAPVANDTATAVYTDILGDELFGAGNDWILSYAESIEKVRFLGNIAPISMSNWFDGCTSLTDIYGMAEHLNTSNVLFMDYAFARCEKLTELDLSGFKTASVMDMQNMFNGCSILKTIYASDSFVTSGIIIGDGGGKNLFVGCEELVGGNDTAFNSTKIDHTYARIDGGTDAPGYFTLKSTSTIAAEPACTCEIKCTALNEACEVCKTDYTKCTITEDTTDNTSTVDKQGDTTGDENSLDDEQLGVISEETPTAFATPPQSQGVTPTSSLKQGVQTSAAPTPTVEPAPTVTPQRSVTPIPAP